MAKKAKKAKAAPAEKEVPAAPSEVTKLISESAFKTLTRALAAAESDKNESVGRIGSLVNQAVEKHNVNKWALAQFRRLKRMSPAKANDALAQLDHFCDISGLSDLLAQQNEMFATSETGAIDEVEEEVELKPRKGSFAEKVRQSGASLAEAENAAEPAAAKPKGSLSPAEVKTIADRAEASTTH